jgi:DNA processing protein
MNVRKLTRRDPSYPPFLAAIHDPPRELWLRGVAEPELLSRTAVAVVGARACSAYGRGVARSLGREIAAAGVVVLSGMARGVDGEAHRGALDAGGTTMAVLGCGIDRNYPAAHAELASRICERGLIVSEYEPGVEPAPWRFPARNRIISGLARAVVVVEARERSGALITVDFALEQGRDVLAVPGEITSALSAGSNALLRLGAAPALSVDDVLEAVGIVVEKQTVEAPSGDGGILLGALRDAPATADELARSTGLAAADVAALLVSFELDGRVSVGEGVYRLAMTSSGSSSIAR